MPNAIYFAQPALSSEVSGDSCSEGIGLGVTLVGFAATIFADESICIVFAFGLSAEYSTLPKLQNNDIVKKAIISFFI